MTDRVLIIAEAGVNHNGSFENAMKMIDVAADSGADVIKFQTFKAEMLATPGAQKAEYQISNTKTKGSQVEMLRALELHPESYAPLAGRCRARGIGFMSTAFDRGSLELLASLDVTA